MANNIGICPNGPAVLGTWSDKAATTHEREAVQYPMKEPCWTELATWSLPSI